MLTLVLQRAIAERHCIQTHSGDELMRFAFAPPSRLPFLSLSLLYQLGWSLDGHSRGIYNPNGTSGALYRLFKVQP